MSRAFSCRFAGAGRTLFAVALAAAVVHAPAAAQGTAAAGAGPAAAAVAAPAAPVHAGDAGARLFGEHCSACHDPTGAGIPGFGPTLAGPVAARVRAGGREYLAQVVVHGITGLFEVAGQRQLGVMPAFGQLPDEDLAAALNHVVFELNAGQPGDAKFGAADIAAARKVARTPAELDRARQALARAAR